MQFLPFFRGPFDSTVVAFKSVPKTVVFVLDAKGTRERRWAAYHVDKRRRRFEWGGTYPFEQKGLQIDAVAVEWLPTGVTGYPEQVWVTIDELKEMTNG